jgi:hypothetical protein
MRSYPKHLRVKIKILTRTGMVQVPIHQAKEVKMKRIGWMSTPDSSESSSRKVTSWKLRSEVIGRRSIRWKIWRDSRTHRDPSYKTRTSKLLLARDLIWKECNRITTRCLRQHRLRGQRQLCSRMTHLPKLCAPSPWKVYRNWEGALVLPLQIYRLLSRSTS